VEVLLLVPWVVLSELDALKGSTRKQQAESARHALHRLRALTAERDTYIKAQPVAEHARVGVPLGCSLLLQRFCSSFHCCQGQSLP
jgi:predicted ribonuclease YlaK